MAEDDSWVPLAIGGGALALIIATGIGLAVAGGGAPPNYALASAQWRRSVIGRMYSFGQWALPASETPTSVGNTLASLNPTFVSGLVRVEAGGESMNSQILADFATVRSIVQATSPACLFDIWFRPTQYATAAALTTGVQAAIATGIPADVLSFDSFDSISAAYQQAARLLANNARKKLLGDINPNTPGSVSVAPDVATTSDWPSVPGGGPVSLASVGFMLGPAMATKLVPTAVQDQIPLLLHINNGPNPVDSLGNAEHVQYANVLNTQQRESFNLTAARLQADNGYAYMYGPFWPDVTVGPPSVYYDANSDDAMLAYLQQLMAQYNG